MLILMFHYFGTIVVGIGKLNFSRLIDKSNALISVENFKHITYNKLKGCVGCHRPDVGNGMRTEYRKFRTN